MSKPPYLDPSLSTEERVQDLLGRMTLEEKAAQTAAPFGAVVDVHAPPAEGWGCAAAGLSTLGLPPRETAERANELQRKHVEGTKLGIPVLLAEEALVGFKVRDAVTFPDAIAQAATWDPDLIETMARTIGRQMAAVGARQALSPLADVARDPRWGRVEETYGEEPHLVAAMATAFVRGLQDAVPDKPLIATLKHFIGYSASDGGRNTEAAQLGPNELREVHAPGFTRAVREAGARSVMPSYNALDGVPVTGSRSMLTALLREEIGFDGLVISDLAAVSQLHTKHGTAASPVHAVAQAIRAGVDMDLDNAVSSHLVVQAVRDGLLTETELDRAVTAVLRTKIELGLFEEPYVDIDTVPQTFDSEEDRRLARTIAERAVVLLQNRPHRGSPLLPLAGDHRTVAVIGPNADRPLGHVGNYSYHVLDSIVRRFAAAADPQAEAPDPHLMGADEAELVVDSVPVVTVLEGIRDRLGDGGTVLHEPGCSVAGSDESGFAAAVDAARRADVAVLVLGDQSGINCLGTVGEGLDSTDCALPGVQRRLAEAVVASGTPTAVVLSHGRFFELGWLADLVPAVITGFFAGEEAGTAIAAVLFGDVDPGGRLPMALLASTGAAPIPYWRTLGKPGYVQGSSAAVYPFGHGLSYTSFAYDDLQVAQGEVPTDGVITLSFGVTNTGTRAGDEVVQVYGQDVIGSTVRRTRDLVGFARLHLQPGQRARVRVEVPASLFALWSDGDWVVEGGEVRLHIGSSSADIRLQDRVVLTGADHRPGAGRALRSTLSWNLEDTVGSQHGHSGTVEADG